MKHQLIVMGKKQKSEELETSWLRCVFEADCVIDKWI